MTLLTDLRAAIENCRACEHHATADLMERAVAEIDRLAKALTEEQVEHQITRMLLGDDQ